MVTPHEAMRAQGDVDIEVRLLACEAAIERLQVGHAQLRAMSTPVGGGEAPPHNADGDPVGDLVGDLAWIEGRLYDHDPAITRDCRAAVRAMVSRLHGAGPEATFQVAALYLSRVIHVLGPALPFGKVDALREAHRVLLSEVSDDVR